AAQSLEADCFSLVPISRAHAPCLCAVDRGRTYGVQSPRSKVQSRRPWTLDLGHRTSRFFDGDMYERVCVGGLDLFPRLAEGEPEIGGAVCSFPRSPIDRCGPPVLLFRSISVLRSR